MTEFYEWKRTSYLVIKTLKHISYFLTKNQ